MEYSQIKDILEERNINDTEVEIVSCVNSSLCYPVTDEVYNDLCHYVYRVWSEMDNSYFQHLTDIIVDCFDDKDFCQFGYRDKLILTLDDIRNGNKIEEVQKIFFDTLD